MSMRLQWFTGFPSDPAAVGVVMGGPVAVIAPPPPVVEPGAEPGFECTACGYASGDVDDMLEHMRREGARKIEMSPVL